MDGGIFSNNPSMVTMMYLMKLGWDTKDIFMLSLGTGSQNRPYFYHEVKTWTNLQWVMENRGVPIISMLMQGQAFIVDEYMNILMNGDEGDVMKKNYIRIDGKLEQGLGNDALDDASEENIRELELLARRLMEETENRKALERVAQMAMEVG